MRSRLFAATLAALVFCLVFSVSDSPATAKEHLSVNKALFARQVQTFGIYTEESSSRFNMGAQTVIYAEIGNFTLKRKGEFFNLDLIVDVMIQDAEGAELMKQEGVIAFDSAFKSEVHDLFFTIDLPFEGWPPGIYNVRLTVNDNFADETAYVDLPVEIFE